MDIEFVVQTPDKKPKPEDEGVESEPLKTLSENLKQFIETPIPLPDGFVSSRGLGDLRKKPAATEEAAEAPAAPITLDIEVPDPAALRMPTRHEQSLAKMDPDDPRVLLSHELGLLPGIDPARAARMANSLDAALGNVNVTAKRELDLARRQARRAAQEGSGKRRGKRRKRR